MIKQSAFSSWKSKMQISVILTLLIYVMGGAALCFMQSSLPAVHKTYMPFFRSILIFLACTIVLFYFIDSENFKKKIFLSIVPGLIWLGVYTFIFLTLHHTPANHQFYLDMYIRYYRVGALFSLWILTAVCIINEKILVKWLASILQVCTVAISFFVMFVPFSYFAYFLKYHALFDEISLMSILATNFRESKEYLLTMFTTGQLICFICLLLLFITISFSLSRAHCQRRKLSKIQRTVPLIILFLAVFMIGHKGMAYFPFDVYKNLNQLDGGPMQAFQELKQNIKSNDENLYLYDDQTTAKELPGTVIVVIGESACRDYMKAFTPSYPYDTTPWETKMVSAPDFIFFPSAYSNFSNTVMALTQVLTSSNQYNGQTLGEAADIMDVAKKAGCHTYWFSAQGRNGIWDAGVTTIAQHADEAKWIRGHDEKLVKMLETVPKDQNNFIVIHLSGSHYKYTEKIPEQFAKEHKFQIPGDEGDYDTSLNYTDEVLKQIFDYGQKEMKLQAMLYFSDHGENMKYKHVSDPFYYDMIRIPFWIYLSPTYAHKYPDIKENLYIHQNRIFTNDMMFETISGLLHAQSNYYDSQYDLSSPCYAITRQNAKTMRGAMDIADDPIFQ